MIFCSQFMPVILLLAAVQELYAQDATRYQVRIAPAMQLDALSPNRTTTHPKTGSDVMFSSQLWSARTTSGTGAIIRLTTDHAFRHFNSRGFKRDARLRLARVSGNSSARWRFDVADDRTEYTSGDETAAVQVSCISPGNATITMNVQFLKGNLATLQGGQYQMTVTGAISENGCPVESRSRLPYSPHCWWNSGLPAHRKCFESSGAFARYSRCCSGCQAPGGSSPACQLMNLFPQTLCRSRYRVFRTAGVP